ncbi:MAG: hypothetical protein AAB580_02115 [Patescibacteria group bacterium]
MLNKIMRWFYRMSWKKILGFGALALTVIALPLAKNAALNPTRSRSEAALLPKPQPVTSEFQTPKGPPQIFLVDHFFGKVGDATLIHGENLGGLHPKSAIYLAGQKITEENLVSWTGDYIEFKVPSGAKSGKLEVDILGKKASWPGMFFVTDQNTLSEIDLRKNDTNSKIADLIASNVKEAKELLLWLLIVNDGGELTLTPAAGVTIEQNSFTYPVGKVYEVRLKFTNPSNNLLRIEKGNQPTVGIARAEFVRNDGTLVPIKSSPLYVSF